MKTSTKMILGAATLAVVAGGVAWKRHQPAPEAGIATGNGRLEAQLVDIATKTPGRLVDVTAQEGDAVRPGQVLAHMDVAELEASLAKARADVARAEAAIHQSEAGVAQQESSLKLARTDVARAEPLSEAGSLSQRTADIRRSTLEVAEAGLRAARDQRDAQVRLRQAAEAEVARLQAQLADATLVSPVKGRVLYRLAQPGEVLGAGGKALTVVDLSQVYMEVFLPAPQAARVAIGAEATLLLDADPTPIPARVTFVSPTAQFTPKQVETASEREKLTFRVKVEVPQAYVATHEEIVKTGVRGIARIRLSGASAAPVR